MLHIKTKNAILPIMATLALVLLPSGCSCNCGDGVPTGGWKSPYANKIAFIADVESVAGFGIYMMNSDGTELIQVAGDDSVSINPQYISRSPDGSKVLFSYKPRPFNLDGPLYRIGVAEANQKGIIEIEGIDDAMYVQSTWSPDSAKLAILSQRDGNKEIYVMNADGTNQTNITNNADAIDAFPAWSPNGDTIAFVSDREGWPGIYTMNSDGSVVTKLVNAIEIGSEGLMWSPDGSKIAYVIEDNRSKIMVMNADGTDLTQIISLPSQINPLTPAWSPDGSKIAFGANMEEITEANRNQMNIHLIDADGSNLTNLTNSVGYNTDPTWNMDGSKIAFISSRDDNWEIYTMNADGSEQTNISNTPGHEMMPSWIW